MGYGPDEWGYASSGGTASNLMGLWVARSKAHAQERSAHVVIGTKNTHYSVQKACKILGLTFREVSFANLHDISLADVVAVVANIGATVTGEVDPRARHYPVGTHTRRQKVLQRILAV